MATEPQFMPAQAPSVGPALNLQAGNDQSNWMTQATQREDTKALTQQRLQQIGQQQAMMPAIIAKTAADVAMAQGQIASAAVQQNFRAAAGQQMGQATQEFTDAMQLADWTDRSDALSQIQAKYAWMGQIPESKSLNDAIANARVQANSHAVLDAQLQERLDAANAAREGRETVAEITAGSRQGVAETNAGARITAAQTSAGSREAVAQTNAGARVEAANVAAGAGLNRAAVHEFSKAADDYENAALKEEDPEKAAALMAKANAFREKAQSALNTAPKPKAFSGDVPLIQVGGAASTPSGAAAAPATVVPQFTPEQIQAELKRRGLAK